MSEEKKDKVDANAETKHLDLEGVCAAGIIDPFLNKPLWQGHRYAKMSDWDKLYCPKHQVDYDRIQQMNKLNELDGK